MYKKTVGNPFRDNHQPLNMALGGITQKQQLAMVA
jgi:hypothetical protein